jgi:hypothetical protein
LDIEKTAHAKPKPGDEQLDFLHRPIRHQSQISGFLERVRADRVQAQNTIQTTEPVLTDKNGCPAEKREEDKQASLVSGYERLGSQTRRHFSV